MKSIALLSFIGLFMVACSSQNQVNKHTQPSKKINANTNQLTISRLLIENKSNAFLNKVEVYLPKLNQRLSCSNVTQLKSCDIQFPADQYNAIYINWVYQQKYRQNYLLTLPSHIIDKGSQELVIKINHLNQIEITD